jgi:hypothetical protein
MVYDSVYAQPAGFIRKLDLGKFERIAGKGKS